MTKHKLRTGILYLQNYLFTRSKWSRLYEACYVHTNWHRIPVAVFRSLLRPSVLKRNCSFQGQLIGQCVATGLIKAKTKVSRRFYTQPVQKKVLELCKIKPAKKVTIDSVWSVLFVLFLTGSVSKQFRVNIAAEIRELDNLRHILLWTIKSDRRFSIPNSNASTINKSIW